MSWIEKSAPTSFDHIPIHGLHFLDGNIVTRLLTQKYGEVETPFFNPNWLKDQKLPQVEFPSGLSFDIWETSSPEHGGIVHLFGEMDLPYFDTRDQAWKLANDIAEQVGYRARKQGENQLELIGHDDDERYLVTYGNPERRMMNVEKLKDPVERPVHPAHVLMNAEIANTLPPLYSNEQIGLESLAPVKYFTPDSNWTWYASEGSPVDEDGYYDTDKDKVDYLFFGLVIGFEIEFGYFSLTELQSAHGSLGLPVERDLYYEPKTLRELQDQHRRERGET